MSDLNTSGRFGATGITDGEQYAEIDNTTGAIISLPNEHYEIHCGEHFHYAENNSLNSGDVRDIIIKTPDTDKYAHFLYGAEGTLKTTGYLFRGTTHNLGATLSAFNSNENSSDVNTTYLNVSACNGIDGTMIDIFQFGTTASGGSRGGSLAREEEIVLKKNTKYLFRLVSGANSNALMTRFNWYEHTNLSAPTYI